MSLNLPIEKAIINIRALVDKYHIQEAILLGGEPLLHPQIIEFVGLLRTTTNLKFIRLTTNGIKLKNNFGFIEKLIDADYGIQGLNISFHNEEFMTLLELKDVYRKVKDFNPHIKIRINTNIWDGNLDSLSKFLTHYESIKFVDEIRVSNIIEKDTFSVNAVNKSESLVLPEKMYDAIFNGIISTYDNSVTVIENAKTLGFVRYVLIPLKCPIIINWNTSSTVSEQICENNIHTREINTFKCLVSGNVSLSWNETNKILIRP